MSDFCVLEENDLWGMETRSVSVRSLMHAPYVSFPSQGLAD